jgi:glutamine synthetase adenylyltransferase
MTAGRPGREEDYNTVPKPSKIRKGTHACTSSAAAGWRTKKRRGGAADLTYLCQVLDLAPEPQEENQGVPH